MACAFESPVGTVRVVADDDGIALVNIYPTGNPSACMPGDEPSDLEREAVRQLSAYFDGKLKAFNLPISFKVGTDFRRKVWQALMYIPYGTTVSYTELATAIGFPRASRAVGSANAANPIAIIVPCHRVIHGDGSPGGYAHGPDVKLRLLELEKGHPLTD